VNSSGFSGSRPLDLDLRRRALDFVPVVNLAFNHSRSAGFVQLIQLGGTEVNFFTKDALQPSPDWQVFHTCE